MDSQYKLLSELLSDQATFITSPKTSLANYWGALPPCPPVSMGLRNRHEQENLLFKNTPLVGKFLLLHPLQSKVVRLALHCALASFDQRFFGKMIDEIVGEIFDGS